MSKPILNAIHDGLHGFIEAHIVNIPDEKKEQFRKDGAGLLSILVEAGAKGAAEGLADKVGGGHAS